MNSAGYACLQDALQLSAFPLRQPARVQPVTRLERIGDTLAVPPAIAPAPDDLLGHVLFALKHEGINLTILAQALPRIPAQALEAELRKAPNGIYIRKACFLYEAFSGEELTQHSPVKGGFIPLFDPEQYLTMPGERNSRWRLSSMALEHWLTAPPLNEHLRSWCCYNTISWRVRSNSFRTCHQE